MTQMLLSLCVCVGGGKNRKEGAAGVCSSAGYPWLEDGIRYSLSAACSV